MKSWKDWPRWFRVYTVVVVVAIVAWLIAFAWLKKTGGLYDCESLPTCEETAAVGPCRQTESIYCDEAGKCEMRATPAGECVVVAKTSFPETQTGTYAVVGGGGGPMALWESCDEACPADGGPRDKLCDIYCRPQ